MIEEIIRAKPAAAKGRYIISITVSTTMGPGVRVDSSRIRRGEIMLGAGGADATDGSGVSQGTNGGDADSAGDAADRASAQATN